MHFIDVMAWSWTSLYHLSCNACDKRDGDGDERNRLSYRIEAVQHVMDVMPIMMAIVKGLKL